VACGAPRRFLFTPFGSAQPRRSGAPGAPSPRGGAKTWRGAPIQSCVPASGRKKHESTPDGHRRLDGHRHRRQTCDSQHCRNPCSCSLPPLLPAALAAFRRPHRCFGKKQRATPRQPFTEGHASAKSREQPRSPRREIKPYNVGPIFHLGNLEAQRVARGIESPFWGPCLGPGALYRAPGQLYRG